jgi:hypothetical protein
MPRGSRREAQQVGAALAPRGAPRARAGELAELALDAQNSRTPGEVAAVCSANRIPVPILLASDGITVSSAPPLAKAIVGRSTAAPECRQTSVAARNTSARHPVERDP